MKFLLIVLSVVVGLIALTSAANPAPDKLFGRREPGDERLLYKIVQQKGSVWSISKKVEDVDYPGKGAYSTQNITYIECINQTPHVESTVEILKGGVGFPFVRLHFKAPRFQGYNYILQIYGKQPHVLPQQPIYPNGPNQYPQYPQQNLYPPSPYNNNIGFRHP